MRNIWHFSWLHFASVRHKMALQMTSYISYNKSRLITHADYVRKYAVNMKVYTIHTQQQLKRSRGVQLLFTYLAAE